MTKKVLLIIALVVGIPLLGWLDVWLAFQFGGWISDTFVTSDETRTGGPEMVGFFAFFVLVATQWVAVDRILSGVQS